MKKLAMTLTMAKMMIHFRNDLVSSVTRAMSITYPAITNGIRAIT